MITEEKLKTQLLDYLNERGDDYHIGDYEDKEFLIVDSWETVNAANEYIAQHSGDEDITDLDDLWDYSWGFSDEYSYCSNCCNVIRTSPDCYGWTPDFWLSDCEGYVCGDCVKADFIDEYIDDLLYKAQKGKAVGCYLLDPTDYGFALIAEGLEHGLHHGQNDDPRKLLQWAKERGLQALFTLQPGQFDVSFDLYLRRGDDDDSTAWIELTADEVTEIQNALGEVGSYNRFYLHDTFKQWPTPAQICEEGLKHPVVHKVSAADFIAGKALDNRPDAPVVQIVIED